MFKLKQSDTFTWPVEVKLAGDGGKFEKHTFDAEFKRVSQPRIDEIALAVGRNEMGDRQVCEEVVVGWSGITEDGEAVPFSPTNLGRILDLPGVARAISATFVAAHTGAAAKN